VTQDQQISILWHACHGLLPPWAQKFDVPVVEPFADIYADKLIHNYDKELAEKLVSIGVSRGGLWSRCMSVRAIVEANPIPSESIVDIPTDATVEDVLKQLIREVGFDEVDCILQLLKGETF